MPNPRAHWRFSDDVAGLLTSSSSIPFPTSSHESVSGLCMEGIIEVTAAGLYRNYTCFPIKPRSNECRSVPNPSAKVQRFFELRK